MKKEGNQKGQRRKNLNARREDETRNLFAQRNLLKTIVMKRQIKESSLIAYDVITDEIHYIRRKVK